jgi:hypothetical protein
MGYLSIDNLYRNQEIMMFKECWAMEKIHGTSAHIRIETPTALEDTKVSFYAGGEKHENFIKLFNIYFLKEKSKEIFPWQNSIIIIYGEAYGGKQQGMSATYGKELKFIVFDVKIGHSWLDVPKAEEVAKQLNLEFVWYTKTTTDIESLDKVRTRLSEQAKRNGCGEDKKQEGVVLRPLIELKKNNGERIISKHKNEDFRETKTVRKVGENAQVLKDANKIADEYVTEMRLSHILGKFPEVKMEQIREIIGLMITDIEREAEGEIVLSKETKSSISRKTAAMFKQRIQGSLYAKN